MKSNILTKLLFFSFLVPFMIYCAGTIKKSSRRDKTLREMSSESIIDQARYLSQEVLAEGRENADFLLQKLKAATNKYKALQKRLAHLEKRVQRLVRQIQSREDVEITVEEDGETALLDDSSSLFEEEERVEKPSSPEKTTGPSGDGPNIKTAKNQADTANQTKKPNASSPEKLFIRGQNLFIEQSWEKAIEVLEEYRRGNPKGPQYPSATYLIGRAFQELDMKEEAQIFFKELMAEHPKSPFAEKARQLIKKP